MYENICRKVQVVKAETTILYVACWQEEIYSQIENSDFDEAIQCDETTDVGTDT